MTEDEAKAEAAEAQIRDMDDAGEPTTRPGAITDALPNPYKNKKEAEAKNNGAAPPDLSLMAMVCHRIPSPIEPRVGLLGQTRRRRLHLRAVDQLLRPTGRRSGRRWQGLQSLLPRRSDCYAPAAVRRANRVQGRDPCHTESDGQGRDGIHAVVSRAVARQAQAIRTKGNSTLALCIDRP